jgi:hypothetical protein
MNRRALLFAAGLAPLAAACGASSSTGTDASSDPFVGTWQCTGSDNRNFTFPPGISRQEDTASTIAIQDNGDGTILSTRTNDAGVTCATRSSVAGAKATLESGQACESGGLTLKLTSGGGNVTGNMLVALRSYDFAGTLTFASDAGPPQTLNVAGTGTSSDNCTKE